MNFLFISPHFPENYVPFSVQLNRQGVRVLGIGDAEYGSIHPDLRASLTEYYRVSSLEDRAQVLEAGRFFRNKYGPIDRVESFQEYWIPMEAALRDALDVPGIGSRSVNSIRRKSFMKSKFQDAGIPTARGALLEDLKQAQRFALDVGYPFIIKPDDGVGAEGASKIQNEQELVRFFGQMRNERHYFMEEFISGCLVSFDGLMDQNGRIAFCTKMDFPLPIMDIVHRDGLLRYYTSRELSPRLRDYGERIIKAFDIKERFFHFEFFWTEQGDQYVALEVNFRPPGLLTTDMWNYMYDMDIYAKYAQLIAKGVWQDPGEPKYFVGYAARKNRYHYRHSHEECLSFTWPRLVHYESIPAIFRAVGGDIAYILRARERSELLPCLEYIQAMV